MSGFFRLRPGSQTHNLLVADDEGHFRDAMKKKLMARGYQVVDVKTGAEAIDSASKHPPEVVIIDQQMPDMKGIQAARAIKKKHPDIRVILLTGYSGKNQSGVAKDKVVYKNLYKPCGIAELIDTIESARRERNEEIIRREIPKGFVRRFFGWMIESVMKMRSLFL